MKKLTTQLGCALFCAAVSLPAMAAETDVNVFGRAHLSLDHLDNSEESSQFLNTNSSRIGVSSATELRDGLTAEAQYIARVALSYGAGGNRDQDLIVGSRESYLGLAGDFGVVRAGRITAPMQVHMDRFQMFGDQIGDAGVSLAAAVWWIVTVMWLPTVPRIGGRPLNPIVSRLDSFRLVARRRTRSAHGL